MRYLAEAQRMLGGGRLVGSRKDQLMAICPFCRGRKFYLNVRTGSSGCKSGRCKARFRSINSLDRALSKITYIPIQRQIKVGGKLDPWRGEDPEEAVLASKQPNARAYLRSRCINRQRAEKLNIWAMKKRGTLIFPLYNFFNTEEETPYYRFLSGALRWVGEAGFQRVNHCFGAQFIDPPQHSIVVVEGIFDLLSPGLEGYGISTLGAEVSAYQMAWLANWFKHIYHLPDNDAAGAKCAKDLGKLCKTYGLKYTNVNEDGFMYRNRQKEDGSPYEDPGDFHPDDPLMKMLRDQIRRDNGTTRRDTNGGPPPSQQALFEQPAKKRKASKRPATPKPPRRELPSHIER